MLMRIRLPELLKERAMTPYAVAKASRDRVSLSALYRLVRSDGHARYLDSEMLEALCDVFDVTPGDLLERDRKKGR